MPDPTLKPNDKGPAVALAQDLLNGAGAILDADGDFGGGTKRAVHEFRLANGLPAADVIDDDLWQRLRALPEPSPDLPTRAVAFIAREEVGGRDYYDATAIHPEWPGGASGVTIGVGYDLGYQAGFAADWGDLLTVADLAALKPWLGKTGDAAAAGPAQLTNITIPWHAAWSGYIRRTLPQEIVKTRQTFIAPAGKPLPPLCLGMLVSLVYNRGTAMTDNSDNDRRKEMRIIRDAVKVGDYAVVPAALLAMQRLWPSSSGLYGRRAREAKLFTEGLA